MGNRWGPTLVASLVCGLIVLAAPDRIATAGERKAPRNAFKIYDAFGPRFEGFGMDVKHAFELRPRAASPERFRAYVKHPAVHVVRVPFSAKTFDEDKRFDPRRYGRLVRAMKEMQSERPRIQFLLSRKNFQWCKPGTKSVSCKDFPAWMKEGGRLVPNRYGRYLAEVLGWFRAQGFEIRYLGPDNEALFNEVDLWRPARWNLTIDALQRHCQCRLPVIVGYDQHRITPEFSRKARVQRVAIHSNVRKFSWHRSILAKSIAGARAARKPVWNTEFHWNHWSRGFMSRHIPSLKQLLWQQCRGVRLVTMWNYHDSAFRNRVMTSLHRSRCRRTVSFMPGVTVYANDRNRIWVVNSTQRTYRNRRVDNNRFRYIRWTSATPRRGVGYRTLGFPARSITLIRR